jgi:hypothetical protein
MRRIRAYSSGAIGWRPASPDAIPAVIPALAAMLLKNLKVYAPKMLKEYRALDTGFRAATLRAGAAPSICLR